MDPDQMASCFKKKINQGSAGQGLIGPSLVTRKPVFGVSTKRDSNQSPQLQRLARKMKFRL